MNTITTIPANVAALIPYSQLAVTLSNLAAYSEPIERLGRQLQKCPKIGESDGIKEHPAIFHYFAGSTDIYICEYDGQDEMFGFCILGGDVEMSEFGCFSLNELRNIGPLNIDYYFDEQTIEAARYKKYPDYFAEPLSML
jgi:hypothetical protein